MAGKINPFGKVVNERSAIDILQENFGIGIKEYDRGADAWDADAGVWAWSPSVSQDCVVEFSVNEGKGTGRQIIPVSEFREYVASLRSIIESGYKEPEGADRTAYVPTNVIALQSFKMVYPRHVGADGKVAEDKSGERNIVSVRCTSGKGAKPMMIPRDQFGEVVGMLRQIADNLDAYELQAWSNYNAAIGKQ
jgi:hypothetical protein